MADSPVKRSISSATAPAVVPGQLQPEPADGVDAGRVEPEVPREPLLDEAELLVEPGRDLLPVERGEVTDQVGPAPLQQVVLGVLVPLLDDRARPVAHVGGVGRGESLPQRGEVRLMIGSSQRGSGFRAAPPNGTSAV